MRLVLDSIVLHNFKSYKGTHNIKNIDKTFTAIVGPNGSGKSNVIDSILFVLGFRAKKMRHSQVTDLIYNDGTREKYCYVELVFNKFRIRREVHLNKTTKYFVDGDESSSADVVKLMMDEGVDMEHNRFLILQGEIESIAMMKPKEGLLEFLEDIIGTSVYKKEIEAAQKEIKDLEQARADTKTSLAFVKKDFDHAQDLKIKNEEALNDKLEYCFMQAEVNGMNRELLSRELSKKLEDKDKLGIEIEALRSTNEETRKIFNTYEKKYKKVKERLSRKETSFLTAKRDYKKVERQHEIQKEAKNKVEKKIKTLKQEIRTIRSKNEMKEKERDVYLKELAENEAELKDLYKTLEKTKASLVEEEKKTPKGDLKLLKEGESRLIHLLDKKLEVSNRSVKLSAEINLKMNSIQTLEEEEKALKERISKIEETRKSSNLNRPEIESKLKDLESDILLTQKELQKRKNRFVEATQKQETDKKEQEMMRHFSSVRGVVGRLQDVGKIGLNYDTALRVACSRLNNIIVDTTTTAEKCIEIIKKKNIPRSTFIVMDKLKETPVLERLPAPYLFELVECDEEYRKCFYFALSDTILCENLEDAERLAFGKQRRRVVTLDGKLIEKSGVMTGGKGVERVKNYGEIEESLKKMETVKTDLLDKLALCEETEKYKAYRSEMTSKEKTRQRMSKEMDSLKSKIKDLGLEDLDTEISQIKETINAIKARVEKESDGTIRSLQGDLRLASEKIEILERRCQDIKIYLADTVLDTLRDKEDELNRLENIDQEVTDKEILNSLRWTYEKEEKEYNEILAEFKDVQEEMNSSKKKMGDDYHNEIDLKNKFEDLEEKIGDIQSHKQSLEEDLKRIETDFKELQGLASKIRKDSLTIPSFDGSNYSTQDIKDFLKKQEKRIKAKVGGQEVNPKIFDEYLAIKKAYDEAQDEYTRISDKYKAQRSTIESLKNRRYDEFMAGFAEVSKFLKEIYKTLTYGGNAELELVDYLDPFSEGIVLAVMPPKKCWKNVSNLSGGEKTLSSLALIFALHKYRPSPFYVMDEIDAALDYRNVSIISNYLKEMTKNSQFIVISLRNDMFEMANSVLGVYKTDNVSKFMMINVSEIKSSMMH